VKAANRRPLEIDLYRAADLGLPKTDKPLAPEACEAPDGRTGWCVSIPGGRPIATPAYDDGLLFAGGRLVEELRDLEQFRQIRIENGTITFPNGFDICPDVLRFYCELGHVASQEETDAAFAFSVRSVAEAREEYGEQMQ
jgi:hypothetical protein